MELKVKDPIIKRVVEKFVDRSAKGYDKYGVTLMQDPSDLDTWLNHLQEELMDAVNYLERTREELQRQKVEILKLKGEWECQRSIWPLQYPNDIPVTFTACNCTNQRSDGRCCQEPLEPYGVGE